MQILKKLTPIAYAGLLLTPKRKERITARQKKKKPKKKNACKAKRVTKTPRRGKKSVRKQRFGL